MVNFLKSKYNRFKQKQRLKTLSCKIFKNKIEIKDFVIDKDVTINIKNNIININGFELLRADLFLKYYENSDIVITNLFNDIEYNPMNKIILTLENILINKILEEDDMYDSYEKTILLINKI